MSNHLKTISLLSILGVVACSPNACEMSGENMGGAGTIHEGQSRVFFEFDQPNKAGKNFQFDEQGQTVGRNYAAFANQHGDKKVVLEGHADDRGPDEYNRALSAHRTHVVAKELERNGVAPDRISEVAYGKDSEHQPAPNAQSEEQHAQNRVVVMKLS